MGILLPPVTQVTTVASNHLTLHHRNRSLDSALQRIPEVDVTPSPECENANVNLVNESHKISSSQTKAQHELASLGSDDSGILCGSESGSSDTNTRESSVEFLSNNQSQESLDIALDTPSKQVLPKISVNTGDTVDCCGDAIKISENEKDSNSKINEVVNKTDKKETCVSSSNERTISVNSHCSSSKPSTDLLLRLLESQVFDISMAIQYLFQSKEPGVQSYIANKMFNFEDKDADFYLPQLVCMYIQIDDVAEVIHPYLVHRY